MQPEAFGALLAFVMGACVGSFVGAIAYRLPRALSIVAPRSFCPHCKKLIPAWANVPLVSYLLLRGRCASCRAPIGFRYFLVELALATAAMYLYLQFPLPDAIARFAFCSVLFAVGMIDFDWRVIPNAFTWGIVPIGIMAAWLAMPEVGWRDSLIGAVSGSGFLALTGAVYRLVRGREGIASGDISLLAATGAFLGWFGALFTLFVGSMLGSIGGIAIVVSGWAPAEKQIPDAVVEAFGPAGLDLDSENALPLGQRPVPFGPFLALAAAIFTLFQPQLVHWYFAS